MRVKRKGVMRCTATVARLSVSVESCQRLKEWWTATDSSKVPPPSQDYFSAAEQQERPSQESERMELDSPGENQQGGVK